MRVVTDEQFNAQDVTDLLFYVQSWTKMVSHHHLVEESYIFPGIERFTGRPGFMDETKHEHELFHDGIAKLLVYASATKSEEYRWEGTDGMKGIIDSFSKHLTDHLYAEIDSFLAMEDLDSAALKKTWEKAVDIAKKTGNLAMLVSHPLPPLFTTLRTLLYVMPGKALAAGANKTSLHPTVRHLPRRARLR